MKEENDRLNEHVSQQSTTLDPTLEDSAHIDPFQEAREEAIEDATLRWIGSQYWARFGTKCPIDAIILRERERYEGLPVEWAERILNK